MDRCSVITRVLIRGRKNKRRRRNDRSGGQPRWPLEVEKGKVVGGRRHGQAKEFDSLAESLKSDLPRPVQ